jgi:hypothetical protein
MKEIEETKRTKRECRQKKSGMLSFGRIVDAKVEADGDIHIALEDATGNRRCHRGVGAKVLTNLCQEWLRKFLEFLLSDRDRSRLGRSEYQRDNDSDD